MARARRVVRRAPGIRGLGLIAQSISRTQSQVNRGFRNYQPATIPQSGYVAGPRTTITAGYAAAIVPASGTVTIYCGPQGQGMTWYPQSAAISTTTGANDASTCTIYLSPLQNGSKLAPTTQIGGQSYAGGGDTIGLSVAPLKPGIFIVAQWTGAKPGDLAAIQVYGTQTALSA